MNKVKEAGENAFLTCVLKRRMAEAECGLSVACLMRWNSAPRGLKVSDEASCHRASFEQLVITLPYYSAYLHRESVGVCAQFGVHVRNHSPGRRVPPTTATAAATRDRLRQSYLILPTLPYLR